MWTKTFSQWSIHTCVYMYGKYVLVWTHCYILHLTNKCKTLAFAKSKNFTHVKAMIYLPSAALRFRPHRMRRKTQPASYQAGLRPRHSGHSSGCAPALKRFIHFYRFVHTDGLLHRYRYWHKACAFRAFDGIFYIDLISIPVDVLLCPCYFFREQKVNSLKT